MSKGPKWTFSQRRHTSGQQVHKKKLSTSLTTREMPSKTTVRYHLKPVRMANIKNQQPDFPGGSVAKNPLANAGDPGSIPGLGRFYMPWRN